MEDNRAVWMCLALQWNEPGEGLGENLPNLLDPLQTLTSLILSITPGGR